MESILRMILYWVYVDVEGLEESVEHISNVLRVVGSSVESLMIMWGSEAEFKDFKGMNTFKVFSHNFH